MQLGAARVSGVELHYVERGAGPAVVFVHGSLDDYRYWEDEVETFSRPWRAVAYSRRYNHPNHNPFTGDHSAVVEARDLGALIEALGLAPACVAGKSYGAMAALFLALERPELVQALVLGEPPLMQWLAEIPGGAPLREEFYSAVWRPTARAFRAGQPDEAVRITIDWFLAHGTNPRYRRFDEVPGPVREYVLGNAREWEALTTSAEAFPPLTRERVAALRKPVLLLSGGRSLPEHKLIDGELQRVLPCAERVVIPEATHDLWGTAAEPCRHVTLAFLEQHRPRV